jgi:hypothetical protein
MTFDTVEDIKKVISRREQDFSELHTRMDEDFQLWALEKFKPVKGYESYTTPSPKNFFDKVVDGLARAAMTISIKLPEDATQEEKDASSKGELYLFGALAAIDRGLRKRGEPALRAALGFLMGLRGWLAFRVLVYVPKGEKDTVFDVTPWDMRHVTYETGAKGLIWAAYKRMVGASQIMDEYGIDIGEHGEAQVIDFWDAENNSIIVREEFAKEPEPHKVGHVPVFIGAVGNMPSMQEGMIQGGNSSTSGSLLKHRGNSVWHAIGGQYEPWNKTVSSLMDTQKKGLTGSLVHKTRGGKAKIVGDPHAEFRIITLDLNDSLEPLKVPGTPPETAALVNIISNAMEESSLPNPLAFGGTEAPESGRALAIRIEATRSVFNPYTGTFTEGYTWLMEELLTQFRTRGLKATELMGFNPDEEFFKVTTTPKDIDEGWFVLVTVEPRLPRDEAEEIATALAATSAKPNGQPLLSFESARETLLKLRDPSAEEQRVLAEAGKNIPAVRARRVAAALKKQGEDDLAADVMLEFQQEAGQAAPGGGGQGQISPETLQRVIEALAQTAPEVAEELLQELEGGGAPPDQAVEPAAPEGPEAPQPASAAQQGLPVEVIQLLREIAEVLVQVGRQNLAISFVEGLQSKQAPEAGMIEEIIEILIQQGREDLAQALLQLLGVQTDQGSEPLGGVPVNGTPVQA